MRWRLLFEPGRRRPVEVRNHVVMASMTSRGAKAPGFLARGDTRAHVCAGSQFNPAPGRGGHERACDAAGDDWHRHRDDAPMDELAITTAGHRLRRRDNCSGATFTDDFSLPCCRRNAACLASGLLWLENGLAARRALDEAAGRGDSCHCLAMA